MDHPAAYSYRNWILVVLAGGSCLIIGAISATFTTRAKAIAWIDERRR